MLRACRAPVRARFGRRAGRSDRRDGLRTREEAKGLRRKTDSRARNDQRSLRRLFTGASELRYAPGHMAGIWGDVPGIVPSTANDMVRRPGSTFSVRGASYGIKKDFDFWRLYALIAARHRDKPDYRVTATLTGRFLGEDVRDSKGRVLNFGGYGHLGCCALLVITKVSDVESAPPASLNLHGVVIGVEGQPVEGFTVINEIFGGSPPGRQTTVTDKIGRFAFSNSGQQLRFESPDYRPIALTVESGSSEIRVRLESAKQSDWIIRACGDVHSDKRVGFSVRFALTKAMESEPLKTDGRQSIFVYRHGGSAPRPTSSSLEFLTEQLRSTVHSIPNAMKNDGSRTRPARLSEWMLVGDG